MHIEPPLQPGERQRNLETLQFIAAETVRRALSSNLASGRTRTNGRTVLTRITTSLVSRRRYMLPTAEMRSGCCWRRARRFGIHGESGIPEGSYQFWQTLFEAISGAGRVVEIEMHPKGLNQEMIDMAHQTGMPVKAGVKFWAEHQGLGYHQADIRQTEYPRQGVTGTFAVSSGERNFTRYGYGDFYRKDSNIEILYRVWPGHPEASTLGRSCFSLGIWPSGQLLWSPQVWSSANR